MVRQQAVLVLRRGQPEAQEEAAAAAAATKWGKKARHRECLGAGIYLVCSRHSLTLVELVA